MPAKLYLLFPLKKCLTDLIYKVTDVSAPAPRFNSSYNGFLCESTVFALWVCERLCNQLSDLQAAMFSDLNTPVQVYTAPLCSLFTL